MALDPKEVQDFLDTWLTISQAAAAWTPAYQRQFGSPLTENRLRKLIYGEKLPLAKQTAHRVYRKFPKLVPERDYIEKKLGGVRGSVNGLSGFAGQQGTILVFLNPAAINVIIRSFGRAKPADIEHGRKIDARARNEAGVLEAYLDSEQGTAAQVQEAAEIDALEARGNPVESIGVDHTLPIAPPAAIRREAARRERKAVAAVEEEVSGDIIFMVRLREGSQPTFVTPQGVIRKAPADKEAILAYAVSAAQAFGEMNADIAFTREMAEVAVAAATSMEAEAEAIESEPVEVESEPEITQKSKKEKKPRKSRAQSSQEFVENSDERAASQAAVEEAAAELRARSGIDLVDVETFTNIEWASALLSRLAGGVSGSDKVLLDGLPVQSARNFYKVFQSTAVDRKAKADIDGVVVYKLPAIPEDLKPWIDAALGQGDAALAIVIDEAKGRISPTFAGVADRAKYVETKLKQRAVEEGAKRPKLVKAAMVGPSFGKI